MRKPENIADLMSGWRFASDLANEIDIEKRTIYRFCQEGKLSIKYWPRLVAAARTKKLRISYAWLAEQIIEANGYD